MVKPAVNTVDRNIEFSRIFAQGGGLKNDGKVHRPHEINYPDANFCTNRNNFLDALGYSGLPFTAPAAECSQLLPSFLGRSPSGSSLGTRKVHQRKGRFRLYIQLRQEKQTTGGPVGRGGAPRCPNATSQHQVRQ